ncbi:hypothetical protein J4U96_26605, partial [Escherichia coli]
FLPVPFFLRTPAVPRGSAGRAHPPFPPLLLVPPCLLPWPLSFLPALFFSLFLSFLLFFFSPPFYFFLFPPLMLKDFSSLFVSPSSLFFFSFSYPLPSFTMPSSLFSYPPFFFLLPLPSPPLLFFSPFFSISSFFFLESSPSYSI